MQGFADVDAASATLSHLYSQPIPAKNAGLVVCEELCFIGVLTAAGIDFYDLTAKQPEEGLHSINFLCTLSLGDSVAAVAVSNPHDPSTLVIGTTVGTVAFVRCRRTLSAVSVMSPWSPLRPNGPLLVHKTLEKQLTPPGQRSASVDALCFHPSRRSVCAVACGGAVHLVHHDVGVLATRQCCGGGAPVRSLAWCGAEDALLACGESGGLVRVWRVSIDRVAPLSPTRELCMTAECVGDALRPPSDTWPVSVGTMRWAPFEGDATSSQGAHASGGGVLCCGYEGAVDEHMDDPMAPPPAAPVAYLGAWSMHAEPAKGSLVAWLPVAPLQGGASLLLSDPLNPRPLEKEIPADPNAPARATSATPNAPAARATAVSAAVSAASAAPTVLPNGATLTAQPFRAAAAARWLLCAASGSSAVCLLPWGRASSNGAAPAAFPSAVELLRTPSLQLQPPTTRGVRAIHRIASSACRSQLAHTFEERSARALASVGAAGTAGCEIVLVLTDAAMHFVMQAAPVAATDGSRAPPQSQLLTEPRAPPSAGTCADADAAPLGALPTGGGGGRGGASARAPPLVAHLLLSKDSAPPTTHAAGEQPQQRPNAPSPPSAKAARLATGGGDETSALHARIAELERRAVGAEQRLVQLRETFACFAAQSRQQTSELLAAIGALAEARAGADGDADASRVVGTLGTLGIGGDAMAHGAGVPVE